MSYAVIFNVVLPIMLFVVAGYIFQKLGKFESDEGSNLIGYAMKVAIPSMIIVALAEEPISSYVQYLEFFGTFLLVSSITFLVALVFAVLRRMPLLEGSYFAATASLSNTCMIALPILVLLMGKEGAIFGILGVINLIIGLQVMSFLYDIHHAPEGESKWGNIASSLWNTAKQPYFVALIIGIILSASGLKLPVTISTTLELFGNTTAPVALFAVGLDLDFSVFRKNILAIFESVIFKLIAMPILAWFLCQWFGLTPASTVAVVLCSSVAAAKCQYALAKQKHIYVEETAAIVAATTILSIATLAVVVIWLNSHYPEVFEMEKNFHIGAHHAAAAGKFVD